MITGVSHSGAASRDRGCAFASMHRLEPADLGLRYHQRQRQTLLPLVPLAHSALGSRIRQPSDAAEHRAPSQLRPSRRLSERSRARVIVAAAATVAAAVAATGPPCDSEEDTREGPVPARSLQRRRGKSRRTSQAARRPTMTKSTLNLSLAQNATLPSFEDNKAFAFYKDSTLRRTLLFDKSPKGSVDERVADIVQELNGRAEFVTTSSCSGKALFMAYTPIGDTECGEGLPGARSHMCGHARSSHDGISDVEAFFSLEEDPLKSFCEAGNDVWLKVEPFQLDVDCATPSDARRLLRVAQLVYQQGVAVLSAEEHWRVNMQDNQRLEMPFVLSGQPVFNGCHTSLARIINAKLSKNWSRMDRLLQALRDDL